MLKRYTIIASLLIILGGCQKDLNLAPISSATTATFYVKTADFQQGLTAAYAGLRGYPNRILNLSETRSDNIYGVSDDGKRDWDALNNFDSSLSGAAYISEAWASNYNSIYKTNILLDQLKSNGNKVTDPVLRVRFEAEAKFLRAFYYFDLVRYFGKVPLYDHAVTTDEALSISRNDVSDVYNLIISDLKFAADNLPDTYASADKGRATKYAAKGILAEVYMTRSGITYGIAGPGLGVNEWNLALQQLNDIIASSKYSVLPSYASIFSYTNENNAEVVFDVEYVKGGTGLGATFPGLLLPDKYLTSVGTYVYGIQTRPVSNGLLNSYTESDLRKACSVKMGYSYQGNTDSRPLFVKYFDPANKGINSSDWPINFIVLRYTDVLMLKAECILHGATGSQTDVDAIVNMVRQRAGAPLTANVTLPFLMEERRREFIGEGLRWHDLVREGMAVTTMNSWIATDDVQHKISAVTPNYIIYPIPRSEIDVKIGLYTQNPGYN
jgi:hypothetical protein